MLFLVGEPAHACCDGFAATVGNVGVLQAGDAEWHADEARELAAWLPRIDALLPSGTRLDAEHGIVSVYSAGGFPAMHPVAHVLAPPSSTSEEPATDPTQLTRVVVGAYLDAPSAQATASALRSHGVAAFVRPL